MNRYNSGRLIPLEESKEYGFYLPFLEKMGRKVIEEYEKQDIYHEGISLCSIDEFPYLYRLYNSEDLTEMFKFCYSVNGVKNKLERDCEFLKIIRDKINYEEKIKEYEDKCKNFNIKEGSLYLVKKYYVESDFDSNLAKIISKVVGRSYDIVDYSIITS